MRPTLCHIDLSAIAANVATLKASAAAPLCAVVKANGYGHGAIEVARAALDAGAEWLAVALVEEGIELRQEGVEAPILLLSEPTHSALPAAVEFRLTPTVYRQSTVTVLAEIAANREAPIAVHVGVDTGMRRVGAELDDLASVVDAVEAEARLRLEAIWTHCPVADEPGNAFTERQLERFSDAVAALGRDVGTHVANSAAAMTRLASGSFMVRCGIALYGIDPDPALAGVVDLVPSLSLRSEVSFIKSIRAGEAVGYGHRWTADQDTTIATVPIGYADGVRRDFGLRGGTVLIGGSAFPIVGVVTMDQLMVDVGGADVSVGDEVVLIGRQGASEQSANDVAQTLGTIGYEVVCAISSRVPRHYRV